MQYFKYDFVIRLWDGDPEHAEILIKMSVFNLHISFVFCKILWIFGLIFSSPELKAQVSYSDRLLSVVSLSVCPSVCL
jgi:hypothetical protein